MSVTSWFSGSNHSAIEEEESRIGFLSWIGASGSAVFVARIAPFQAFQF